VQRFSNTTALISGASSGIGRATALAFAQEGARVVITARNRTALEQVASANPDRLVPVVADVTSPEDARRAVEVANERGDLTVLVNNAGAFAAGPLSSTTSQTVQQLLDTNIAGVTQMTQAALDVLAAQKGCVVNISSAAGHMAIPGAALYGASKAAVESLTGSLAAEFAQLGVRVNAVAPGPIKTPILERAGMSAEEAEAAWQAFIAQVPLGRAGHPEEIAAWVLHLADPAASWVTGQVVGIDGGMSVA
jgi:NAD(P)-dependent dehydrogenase (short-subunit alcohol dehydrogenase family)